MNPLPRRRIAGLVAASNGMLLASGCDLASQILATIEAAFRIVDIWVQVVMTVGRLVRRSLLDPREAADAAARPLAGAVNIPFSELPGREHELPPREDEIGVGGGDALAAKVVAWLEARGRRAVVADEASGRGAFASGEIGRLWEPNAFLTEVVGRVQGSGLRVQGSGFGVQDSLACASGTAGMALDMACGSGRDAVYLAARGWDVTGVDVSPEALEQARGLERRYVPAARSIHWLAMDLEGAAPAFDREYDLICAFRYLHRPLLARVREWLRPDGGVVCETFTTVHRERHGRPAHDAHVLQPGELRELLRGFDIRHYSEEWHGWAHTARAWAVLPAGG